MWKIHIFFISRVWPFFFCIINICHDEKIQVTLLQSRRMSSSNAVAPWWACFWYGLSQRYQQRVVCKIVQPIIQVERGAKTRFTHTYIIYKYLHKLSLYTTWTSSPSLRQPRPHFVYKKASPSFPSQSYFVRSSNELTIK